MPWILNEDGALKLKLQGIMVSDANSPNAGRPVPVRYRLPEDELATLSYPIIIIEHMPISFAPERQTRGYVPLPYAPEGLPEWWAPGATSFDPSLSPYWTYWPLAVNMDYRVTVYTRKFPEHLQPIMLTLTGINYLPFQFGYLNVPQDGTWRNMFLMEGPIIEYGKDNDDKRLFRATYMVRVMSEIVPTVYVNGIYGALVDQINLDLGVYSNVDNITTEELAANVSLISTGPNLAFGVGINPPPPGQPGTVQPKPTQPIPRRKSSRAKTGRR